MDQLHLPEAGKNNFWYVYNQNDAVLVFIHGVLSDSRGCWLYDDRKTGKPANYWPHLIETDHRFNNPGIYLAGYHTSKTNGDFPIRDCADMVFEYLSSRDAASREPVLSRSKITFICHSMGGIVARSMLVNHQDDFRGKQVGLVLVASPSYGSKLANAVDLPLRLYNHTQGRQLRMGNRFLKELDLDFRNFREHNPLHRFAGIEYYENRFRYRLRYLPFLTLTRVVDQDSASRYFADARLIADSDHGSICKPRDVDEPIHQYLYGFLSRQKLLPDNPSAQGAASQGDSTSASEPLATCLSLAALGFGQPASRSIVSACIVTDVPDDLAERILEQKHSLLRDPTVPAVVKGRLAGAKLLELFDEPYTRPQMAQWLKTLFFSGYVYFAKRDDLASLDAQQLDQRMLVDPLVDRLSKKSEVITRVWSDAGDFKGKLEQAVEEVKKSQTRQLDVPRFSAHPDAHGRELLDFAALVAHALARYLDGDAMLFECLRNRIRFARNVGRGTVHTRDKNPLP